MKKHVLPPLVVDLDGTLIAGDTLVELSLQLVKRSPLILGSMLLWLCKGRQHFKDQVARRAVLDMAALPWRSELLAWLKQQHLDGRQLILATAANQRIADAVAAYLGIFSHALGSDAAVNLKGAAKLGAIQARVGPRFSYAGDSSADLPIWQAAESAILVGASRRTAKKVSASTHTEQSFPKAPAGCGTWLKAIRVHQWLKNVLLFVPLLTSFSVTRADRLWLVGLAFAAFSLAASATYILNDLWDLESDRLHARKCGRPLACGAISLPQGALAAAVLFALGFALATRVGTAFAAMLAGYVLLSTVYSCKLKMHTLMDVVMLAVLYTYRVLAGAVAIGVVTTPALLGFSLFIFLSLALVKRCAELQAMQIVGSTQVRGRDYRVSDLQVLCSLGVSASLCSVVVFGIYIAAPETQTRYALPELLWLVAIGLIHWLSRLWVKTSRGEMHDDPVVYALLDRGSRLSVASMLVVTLLAYKLPLKAWL